MKTSKGYWLGDQQQKERRCSASAVGTVAAAWNKCRTHKQCSSKNDVNKFGNVTLFEKPVIPGIEHTSSLQSGLARYHSFLVIFKILSFCCNIFLIFDFVINTKFLIS